MYSILSNKFSLIGLTALAVMIPLNMIGGLVQERQAFHAAAIEEMSATSTGGQRLTGPVLYLPCEETYLRERRDGKTGTVTKRQATRDCGVHALPKTLSINGVLRDDIRRRGIHEALFYSGELDIKARYVVPPVFGITSTPNRRVGSPSLDVGLSDPRGIMNVPTLQVGRDRISFEPGTRLRVLGTGIHAPLESLRPGDVVEIAMTIEIRGLERFDIVPVGEQTDVRVTSPWRHPSFVGKFLPVEREIGKQGFTATWRTSRFSTGLAKLFADHGRASKPVKSITATVLGVNLIDPVDLYTQADRAVKYGFLFVLVTFVALLATEIVRGLRLHPVQYLMVGVALAVFFLLLLSFAEHVPFAAAYLVAAIACVSLLAFYLRHATGSRAVGHAFAAKLSLLYALLYGLLSSEDYALLTGSTFVFGVLAALMIVTRNVDWYALGGRFSATSESAASDRAAEEDASLA